MGERVKLGGEWGFRPAFYSKSLPVHLKWGKYSLCFYNPQWTKVEHMHKKDARQYKGISKIPEPYGYISTFALILCLFVALPGAASADDAGGFRWIKKDKLECFDPYNLSKMQAYAAASAIQMSLIRRHFWRESVLEPTDESFLTIHNQYWSSYMVDWHLHMLSAVAEEYMRSLPPNRRAIARHVACALAEPVARVQEDLWRQKVAEVKALARQRLSSKALDEVVYVSSKDLGLVVESYEGLAQYYANLAVSLRDERSVNLQRLPPGIHGVLSSPAIALLAYSEVMAENAAFWEQIHEKRRSIDPRFEALIAKAGGEEDSLHGPAVIAPERLYLNSSLDVEERLLQAALVQLSIDKALPASARTEADEAVRSIAGQSLQYILGMFEHSVKIHEKIDTKLELKNKWDREYSPVMGDIYRSAIYLSSELIGRLNSHFE